MASTRDSFVHDGVLSLPESARSEVIVGGIDEAGLGPMLGPLCVGGAVLRLPVAGLAQLGLDQNISPAEIPFLDVWKLLTPTFSKDPKAKDRATIVCDSKLLHSPAKGIRPLEESILPLLLNSATSSELPLSWDAFWDGLAFAPERARRRHSWYLGADLTFPMDAAPDRILFRGKLAAQALAKSGIKLTILPTLAVIESEFNRMVDEHSSKSDLNLAAFCFNIQKIWRLGPATIVACDRLGGRQFYADSLAAHLSPDSISIVAESPDQATYVLDKAFGGVNHSMLLSFSIRGDQKCFPVALASMAAKYTREICMEAFNRFWGIQQPGLKPTKGYVTDARRWLHETRDLRDAMGIEDDLLIRKL